jgi:hypothetical protein
VADGVAVITGTVYYKLTGAETGLVAALIWATTGLA